MASSSRKEADIFSSSPARPSHHRTQLPPKPKPVTRPNLKRSASEAALLTPPASPEKSKPRSAKRSFTDSEEEDDDEDMDSPRGTRKTRKKIAVKEQRAQGRLAPEPSLLFPRGKGRKAGPSTKTSPVGDQVQSMRLDSDDDGIGSPEQPTTPGGDVKMATRAEPTTPTRPKRRQPTSPAMATRAARARAVRDTPNNPFLGGSPRAPAASSVPFEERATMTYVFRGVKAVFRNPAYGGPSTAELERAKLRPDHPDFSPDLMTAPKLLFPSATDPDSDEEPGPPSRQARLISPPPSGHSRARPTKRRKVARDPENIFA